MPKEEEDEEDAHRRRRRLYGQTIRSKSASLVAAVVKAVPSFGRKERAEMEEAAMHVQSFRNSDGCKMCARYTASST